MSDSFNSGVLRVLEQIQRYVEYVHNEQGDYYPIMIFLSIFKIILLSGCFVALIMIYAFLKQNFGM